MFLKRSSYLFLLLSCFCFSVFAQAPVLDGNFDGASVWGTPTNADGVKGWADANAEKLYIIDDGCFLYLGAEVEAAAWMNWVFIFNTKSGGGSTDSWSRSIDYNHNNKADHIFRGHFNGYAEFHSWNGSGWDGIGNSVNSTEFAENIPSNDVSSGWLEVRVLKSSLGNAATGDIQFYIAGDKDEHGSFDAIPNDDNATSWNETNNRTPLNNYITNISMGGSSGAVTTVAPSLPTPDEQVTITFNAACTPLEGESKVYFHSGVSITESSPMNFDRVIGNWGQDDGVGEMVNIGTDLWEITLPSLRTYYNVAITEDVFGLNYLFRSADGTAKEDQNGANYFNDVNTGNYFSITAPTISPFLAEVNTSFTTTSEANTAPNSWKLEEVDDNDNVLNLLDTQNGGLTFSDNISLNNTDFKRFKVTADFGGGEVKFKYFQAKGYDAVVEAARPANMQLGINYDNNDPSKATLIFHAPVYTRQFKGENGNVPTGNFSTPAKDVIYVVGDFNNWELNEAYKLNRDRDGWNGTTDADNDGDRGDYWWIELTGLMAGQEYIFQYYLSDGTQIADPYTEKLSDPDDGQIPDSIYPNLIEYPQEARGRASILQTNQSDYVWEAAPFTKPSTNDLNIYELHFRDFTEEGTYLAAIEKLEYLENMGINAIHVMPVSEFEGNSSWGYNPNFYFAPDKAYGTKDDLKKFIDECHKREIQVFNDLVLNHAFESNVMARMYWDSNPCVPHKPNGCPAPDNPWFNQFHKMVRNTAGHWGVDWNHESEHTQAFMDRALDFWLQEYQFDGFRFDFTKGFGQTEPNDFPQGDEWASTFNADRIGLLKRMTNGMWTRNPNSVVIFEHLANNDEDKNLADFGISMWSGVGHHNDVKGFIFGNNTDNTDIYNSGIYDAPARDFMFANWISYPESHDEQRLAYELWNFYGDFSPGDNAADSLNKVIDRLKIGWAFNLLFPGPRMVWQFGELGYDYDINFNGRTGEKPVRWDYYDNDKRRELYNLVSKLFYLRNNYDLYANDPDYGNIGLGAGNLTTPRKMKINGTNDQDVLVIANLDPNASHNVQPDYNQAGERWYRYNGDPAVDGSSFTVTSANYLLAPSEVLVLTNFEIPTLQELAIKVNLEGAYNGVAMDGSLEIPVTEPFSDMPNFTHVGQGGGESILTEALQNTGNEQIVDWVFLELRDANDNTQVLETRAALLQRDGDVVDVNGTSPVGFNVVAGDYYVVVRPRHHLGVMSVMPVTLSNP
ncbi:MAG: alpha-amylase family glycosyl hydrolase [Bacteroidota bacterium]